ncbi:MAG: hypothetical protein IPL84_09730 [Chitinophagaceae bacterium]|nr:hypothetical protein [Chitinophagaceae bacterium]
MTEDSNPDVLHYDEQNKPKLPSGLNVLTILTFIGSAIMILTSLWSFFTAKKSYDNLDKLTQQMNSDNMPGWAKSMMGDPEVMIKTITKTYENRIPIVLLSLIAAGLCIYGAIQMRKLKKQGFLFYAIGEVLPFLTQFLFIGAFAFAGVAMYVGIAITLLFLFLYYRQRKNLVYP